MNFNRLFLAREKLREIEFGYLFKRPSSTDKTLKIKLRNTGFGLGDEAISERKCRISEIEVFKVYVNNMWNLKTALY